MNVQNDADDLISLPNTGLEINDLFPSDDYRTRLKLLVNNLPKTINLDSIEQVFSKYGELNLNESEIYSNKVSRVTLLTFEKVIDVAGLFGHIEIANNILEVKKKPSTIEKLTTRYNNLNKFEISRICFGNFISKKNFCCYWDNSQDDLFEVERPVFALNFNDNFSMFFNLQNNIFKLNINFRDIIGKIKVNKIEEANKYSNFNQKKVKYTFLITMKTPPKIWTYNPNNDFKPSRSLLTEQNLTSWIRLTDLNCKEKVEYAYSKLKSNGNSPIKIYSEPGFILFQKWLTICLEFEFNNLKKNVFFHRLLNTLVKYNLLEDPIAFEQIHMVHNKTYNEDIRKSLWDIDEDISFFIECLISYNLISEVSINESFVKIIKNTPKEPILKILEYIWATKEKVFEMEHFMKTNLDKNFILPISNHYLMQSIPSHCALIKKVIITPSKFYLIPPTIETTNRIIRKFDNVKHGFLRVVFSEEDLSKIGSNIEECKLVYNRIYTVLRNGIKIGNQKYEFLAFSSSQLREHSCWFYSSQSDRTGNLITCEIIRRWMGDFSNIKTVAKFAARMGQCFSTTVDSEKLNVESVNIIDDIIKDKTMYSDGVGTISFTLMKQVTNKLNLPIIPSAIQFRYGGAKGVLSLLPFDNERDKMQISLRPSQIKFESKHNILEIVRIASYSPCYLNRQIITLLTTLGVTDEVFIRMQDQMILELDKITNNIGIAIKLLTKNPDEYDVAQSACKLIKAGFMKIKDPYLMNLLQLFRTISLRDLKNKSRIFVDRGAILMGVLDETGTLNDNEIFVKISDPQKPYHSHVLNEECIVTRNPCFHPGDIRRVKAVYNKNLSHLINCVVFPQKGPCIPSLCSGGDLDGDLYS